MSNVKVRRTALFLIAALVAESPVVAHHSPAAFDRGTTVEVQGTVTRYDWKNPHVYIFVEGTSGSGQTGEWLIEADPTPLMARSGWTASTLAPGDAVALTMFPDRDPSNAHGLLQSLTTPAGVTFGMRTGGAELRDAARSVAGVWDGLPKFAPPAIDLAPEWETLYTQAALDARAAYTVDQYPPATCVAIASPSLMQLPYLYDIEIREDRVMLRTEFFSVERTVYTDGRDHPVGGPRTIHGHSIGRWEGTTLIVDTRLYADSRLAHGPGVPSGAQKHTIERFELSPSRRELNVEFFVEDPEYVSEPYTVSATWVYAPDRELEPFGCEQENASYFMLE